MGEPILEVKNLKKTYRTKNGTVEAVKGISFHVEKGEVFGFLGANGAGKSTTINMVTTQLLPSGGQILIDGQDLTGNTAAIRRKIGVVAQHNNLERSLTAEENLYFHGLYFGMDEDEIKAKSEELLKKFGLWDRRKDFVKSYSGGMAQRLKIARAMLHSPEILFLDEPTTGLDPNYRNILWDQMLKMNREGTTIFLTTHYMEEVENFCQHVAIMKKGEMLAYGTVKELEERTKTNSLNDVFLVLTNRDGVDDRQSANVEE
jgi:ABC-2 type transport system ATP-binding protein